MKVYLSGKITGLDEDAVRAKFAAAAEFARDRGFTEVVNPVDLQPFDPDKSWTDYMVEDIAVLMTCDAVLLQPDWQDSNGARIEVAIAKGMRIPIYEIVDERCLRRVG